MLTRHLYCKSALVHIMSQFVLYCDVGNMENFMMFLAGAQISISHAVTLAPDDILDWNGIQSMADCQYMASNVEVVPKVNNSQYYSCIFLAHIILSTIVFS